MSNIAKLSKDFINWEGEVSYKGTSYWVQADYYFGYVNWTSNPEENRRGVLINNCKIFDSEGTELFEDDNIELYIALMNKVETIIEDELLDAK